MNFRNIVMAACATSNPPPSAGAEKGPKKGQVANLAILPFGGWFGGVGVEDSYYEIYNKEKVGPGPEIAGVRF
jgi:hypothetical protein